MGTLHSSERPRPVRRTVMLSSRMSDICVFKLEVLPFSFIRSALTDALSSLSRTPYPYREDALRRKPGVTSRYHATWRKLTYAQLHASITVTEIVVFYPSVASVTALLWRQGGPSGAPRQASARAAAALAGFTCPAFVLCAQCPAAGDPRLGYRTAVHHAAQVSGGSRD